MPKSAVLRCSLSLVLPLKLPNKSKQTHRKNLRGFMNKRILMLNLLILGKPEPEKARRPQNFETLPSAHISTGASIAKKSRRKRRSGLGEQYVRKGSWFQMISPTISWRKCFAKEMPHDSCLTVIPEPNRAEARQSSIARHQSHRRHQH